MYHEGGELGTVILPMRVPASGSQFFSVTEGRDFQSRPRKGKLGVGDNGRKRAMTVESGAELGGKKERRA